MALYESRQYFFAEKVADSYTKKRNRRVEPRVKKLRSLGCFLFFSFAYPLMQEPRYILRAKLLSA